jgi:predicted nucleic acid-binding protein
MGQLALFDSNVLIDALNGVNQAVTEVGYFDDIAISAIVCMEVVSKPMVAAAWSKISPSQMQMIRDFLNDFSIIHTNDAIMAEAARVRSSSFINPPKIRLPDAIILATANITGRLLITRNKKDFRGANIRFPYELQNAMVVNVAQPPIN